MEFTDASDVRRHLGRIFGSAFAGPGISQQMKNTGIEP